MTKFKFNDVDYPFTKDEIKSKFNTTFPNANFNKLIEAEFEKAERSYNKLFNDFNSGVYNEHNSICNYVRVAIQSQPLEKDKIVELLSKYDNFEIVFYNMWCAEIKQYVFNAESPSTTTVKKILEYIDMKKYFINKYELTHDNSTELKFDISNGVSSVKSYNKFTYTEEFIMKKLAAKFNMLFPQHSFIGVLNSLYEKSCLTVREYEDEFNKGNYSWSNSRLVETFEFIPSRISSDKLKEFVSKYDNFSLVEEDGETNVIQNVLETESPEYIAVMRIKGIVSDFESDNKKLKEIEEYVSKF